ncbi:VOC family protein [Arsenicicoccus dermatophilus]|uniref:VOC family protein n=1 Tax=Arsenicicoccus dermatophilus TaxID=1076331 RepID=UPI001F4CF80D|nr:VOC family protein [Arsenicicoccus dermatophilus]MCH8611557.1 VOC family protein [Arsenicicoccus dermatophilus]
MPIRMTPWPQGTPCWPDLMADDPASASRFYEQLFGWETTQGPDGYAFMTSGGLRVAGIGPKPRGAEWPAVWTTYLAVDDVYLTIAHAKAEGATELLPPTTLPGMATIALLTEPSGAHFGLWEPAPLNGIERYNEEHAPVWNELMVRDHEDAMGYYSEVFGFSFEEFTEPDGSFAYATMITPSGRLVAGLGQIGEEYGEEYRAHWMTYFFAEDPRAAAARCTQLGGTVLMDVTEGPFGELAVLSGPQGEIFSVIRPEHVDE